MALVDTTAVAMVTIAAAMVMIEAAKCLVVDLLIIEVEVEVEVSFNLFSLTIDFLHFVTEFCSYLLSYYG